MEKKIYPRVSTRLPVVVINDAGVRLKVVAINASSDGFSFQCSTLQRNMVTPGGCYIGDDGRPVEVDAWLDLPVADDQLVPVKARCHVAFSRRVTRDRCEIGMRYMDIDGDGYRNVIRFIENRMGAGSGLSIQ